MLELRLLLLAIRTRGELRKKKIVRFFVLSPSAAFCPVNAFHLRGNDYRVDFISARVRKRQHREKRESISRCPGWKGGPAVAGESQAPRAVRQTLAGGITIK